MQVQITRDGNQWRALYGRQHIAGFGDTILQALADLDQNFNTYLKQTQDGGCTSTICARCSKPVFESCRDWHCIYERCEALGYAW
jgi:hypothetical protein